jgi:hypothetical protein
MATGAQARRIHFHERASTAGVCRVGGNVSNAEGAKNHAGKSFTKIVKLFPAWFFSSVVVFFNVAW